MKVSVIIPVYNVSKYIERCLLSVLNQTWQDLEVILVNDCTPDDSMEIAERVVKAHPRGKDVLFRANEKNKGLSATRNLAIHAATGDYLFFLDSDDYLPLDSLAILSLELQTKKYDFVLGDYEITGQSRSLHSHKMGKRGLHSNEEILSSYSMFLWPRMACNILVNRNFLLSEELFFKEGIVHEDDLWTFQLACKAGSAYFCNKTTYYYYTHSNSITGNPSLWNLQCRVFIVDLMYNYILSDAKLMRNKYVYVTFEETKAKYFDRILYFTKDESFRYKSYQSFRQRRYISNLKAFLCFHLHLSLFLRNLHYAFPIHLGYLYFKFFVKFSYYLLVLPIKVKRLLHIK